MRHVLARWVFALGLCACGDASISGDPMGGHTNYSWVGAPGPTGPVLESSAKPLFVQNVAPVLQTTCAGSECHSVPGNSPIRFLPAPGEDVYASLLRFSDKLVAGTFSKADAQITTRIAQGHYTASYTPEQLTRIQEWLDAEVAARVDLPGTPSVARRMMSELSGCMSFKDWLDEDVAAAWARKETREGECQQCHINGQGWLASLDSERVFTILTHGFPNPATGGLMMEFYIAPDLSDPTAPKLVISRELLKRAGEGNAQHPLFDVEGDAMQRLERFFAKTVIRRSTFQCDSPRFEP